ncbi:GNAT family N-acetyltransferase [Roseivirga misakiensis]|uniref:Uncharacterized protein n=1 Tax=Roseivirga misakiensis TaxID=1563681 RepID=A0A1E5T5R5_9BACT|nr:GNAT family protein [Roseivirga misakiensis]OEK06710.1 hypothetical protein BFP71_03345 [Roseivirga misakiensis]
MRNKEIKKYISWLNEKKNQDLIFTRQISSTVDEGIVWPNNPGDGVVANFDRHHFFFIKNEKDIYVGAILDMGTDLHWYMLKEYRKKGYLTNALRVTILPYLFLEREEQRISISEGIGPVNHQNSKSVATKLGFRPMYETGSQFVLTKEEFIIDRLLIEEEDNLMSDERCELLKSRVNQAYRILLKVSDELTIRYLDDGNLSDLAKSVRSYMAKVDQIHWMVKREEGLNP